MAAAPAALGFGEILSNLFTMGFNYWPLFVALAIAWLTPICLSWLGISKIPAIVVEIALGVLVGPFVLNAVSGQEPYLNFLSYTGFLVLIFLSGLSLDIRKILSSFSQGKFQFSHAFESPLTLALMVYAGSLLVALLAAAFLPVFAEMDRLFIGFLLPSVALSIVTPILKSDGEIEKSFGQVMLLKGAISTMATILLIAVYAGIKESGGLEIEILLFPIIFIAFFIAYKIGKVLVKITLLRRLLYELEHASSQIHIRGAMALLLLFVCIASQVGTEPVLGAFLGGALLSVFMPKERSALLFKLEGMGYGFFIPIFFVSVGVKLDIASMGHVAESLRLVLTFVAVFFLTQAAPALLLIKPLGLRKAFASSILLTSRLGLTIAAAQIGLSLQLISSADNAAIVTACVLTCVLAPALYRYVNSRKESLQRNVYIVGGQEEGVALAERLKMHGVSCLVIAADAAQSKKIQDQGIEATSFKWEDERNYCSKLKVRPLDHVVVLTHSVESNLRIASLIRAALGHTRILTVAQDGSKALIAEGVRVSSINQIIASHLENEIMRPTMAHAFMDSFGAYSVEEISVGNVEMFNKLICDIAFPQSGALITLKRGEDMLIPHGDTRLLEGDTVTVIGNALALIRFRELLS